LACKRVQTLAYIYFNLALYGGEWSVP